MKLLLYSLWGLLWQQMNAAGNLITFLSAPVPFRRQCKSQQHFLLILQVAQKMSNSPPEGLMRAFHLSLKILFRYLEGSLLFFFPEFLTPWAFPSLCPQYHTPRAECCFPFFQISAHLPTPPENQICSPRGVPLYPLPASLPFLSVFGNQHSLGCINGKSTEGWSWENSLFPLIMSCAAGRGKQFLYRQGIDLQNRGKLIDIDSHLFQAGHTVQDCVAWSLRVGDRKFLPQAVKFWILLCVCHSLMLRDRIFLCQSSNFCRAEWKPALMDCTDFREHCGSPAWSLSYQGWTPDHSNYLIISIN